MPKRIYFKLQCIHTSANNNYWYLQLWNAAIWITIYCHVSCNWQKLTFDDMAVPLLWTPLDTTAPLGPLVFTDDWAFVYCTINLNKSFLAHTMHSMTHVHQADNLTDQHIKKTSMFQQQMDKFHLQWAMIQNLFIGAFPQKLWYND